MATVTAHALARIYNNAEKNLSDNFTPSVQIKQIMISDRIKKYYTAIITDGENYVHGQIAIDLTKKGFQDGSIICITDYGIEIWDVISSTGGIYSIIGDTVFFILSFILWGSILESQICKGVAPSTNPNESNSAILCQSCMTTNSGNE